MQVGTAISPAATPFDVSNSTSADSSNATLATRQQQQWQSQRRASRSSGSIGTAVLRPDSRHHIRSESSSRDTSRRSLHLARDSMSQEHNRRRSVALDSSEHHHHRSSDSVGSTANRWSHSTTSSLNSNSRRHRCSSGAILSSLVGQSFSPRQQLPTGLDASPRASPRKKNGSSNRKSLTGSPSRLQSASKPEHASAAITALPSLQGSDPESLSTTSPAVSKPSVHSSTLDEPFHADDNLSTYTTAKTQQITMVRNPAAPIPVSSKKKATGSESPETGALTRTPVSSGEDDGHVARHTPINAHGRKSRTREKTEKDKKTMLSKALQKANTAVLLDNAQNHEGALEAYGDACDLLTQVMDRTSGEDDQQKLDAIRVTYSNRMDELRQLVHESPTTAVQKTLPARPMSEDSLSFGNSGEVATSPAYGNVQHSLHATSHAGIARDVPRLSYPRNDRDSFFEKTMQAVENSTSFDSSDYQHSSSSVGSARVELEDNASEAIHQPTPVLLPPPEHSQYVPRPLSPKRSDVPQPTWTNWADGSQADSAAERESPRARAEPGDSTSWLDTIDESGSSCSDSVHSLDDLQGMRRKHIRGTSGTTDPDFDAAFDAAVEAAYNEGFEPDLDARQKRMTATNTTRHRHDDSLRVPASAIDEILPSDLRTAAPHSSDLDEEEEERILDEITLDYGQGFNFDLQTKSALPRQSDSSGYSRSTWQSSQVSDRATATTSLSTVAEDSLPDRVLKPAAMPTAGKIRGEGIGSPPLGGPPRSALPVPPGLAVNRSSVQTRRLSVMNQKKLKIETSPQPPENRKRASTFHHGTSPSAEDEEVKSARERKSSFGDLPLPTSSDVHHDEILQSPPSLEFHPAVEDATKPLAEEPTLGYRPSYEGMPADLPATRPTLFRKNKSSISLRDHTEHTILLQSPDLEHGPSLATPMSSTFTNFAAAKRNQNPLTSQRANLPSLAQTTYESSQAGGGMHLFDTSLSAIPPQTSPRSSHTAPAPLGLEPCPEPFLLRPFWLMRALSQTIGHPKGGFLSTKLFVPREVWYTRGVKLKLVEDKIANCDLLTAALGRLAGADTYDADAVMEELQSFEEVMERVQIVLAKKLGSDVGVHGVAGMFKDASAAAAATANATSNPPGSEHGSSDKATKSNSGKSYLTSWRKLRNKSSGTPLSGGSSQVSGKATGQDLHTMPSVPMTSYVPVERRGHKRDVRNLVFEGPHKEYMGSLARLFDGVQVLDQIARQVEDPGLRHSSSTHVGLELSIRHAAEFFGFYICRFVLSDLGLLMDKFLKRGTEWMLL